MSARKPAIAFALLAAILAVGVAERALGQGRGDPQKPEIRGVIKSVDAGNITISIPGADRQLVDKSFPLAKNVELAIASGNTSGGRGGSILAREAKLADLIAGTRVALALSADQKQVESVLAETPVTRGRLTAVDATKNTVTISQPQQRGQEAGEDKTYSVAADAEIGVDDGRGKRFSVKEAKLTDLVPGAQVTAWLSLDGKQVQGVLAEGPTFFGILKEIDAAKKRITLTVRPARGDDAGEDKTLSVAGDAVVLIDDGKGRRLSVKEVKLADVPIGATVGGKLSVDQVSVMLLHAEGPTLTGLLKGVDADKGTIVIGIPKGRNDLDEKTLTLAKDARVFVDGAVTTLGNLKVGDNGPIIQVRLTLDQRTVQSVTARQPGSR